MSGLAKRLRAERERRNLKQIQVAEKTGINNKTLSGYENGVSEPDFDTIKRLAELYEVTVDYLLGTNLTEDLAIKETEVDHKLKEIERLIRKITLNKGVEETIDFLNFINEESKKR